MKFAPRLYAFLVALLVSAVVVHWAGRLLGPVLPTLGGLTITLAVVVRLLRR